MVQMTRKQGDIESNRDQTFKGTRNAVVSKAESPWKLASRRYQRHKKKGDFKSG